MMCLLALSTLLSVVPELMIWYSAAGKRMCGNISKHCIAKKWDYSLKVCPYICIEIVFIFAHTYTYTHSLTHTCSYTPYTNM